MSSSSPKVTAFEVPNIAVLVGTGVYIARRIRNGFELVPANPDSGLPVWRMQRLEQVALPEFVDPATWRPTKPHPYRDR